MTAAHFVRHACPRSWATKLGALALASLSTPACATTEAPLARPSVRFEVESAAGNTDARDIRYNQAGYVGASLTPAWDGLRGRRYGERATLAAIGRIEVPFGSHGRVALGGRVGRARDVGDPARSLSELEAASLLFDVGGVGVLVGRDWVEFGPDGRGLMLSRNAPPLDVVGLLPRGALTLPGLGPTRVTAFVADLGGRHVPAHAKLFGLRVEVAPSASVTLGFSSLNKQGGEGGPDATLTERIKDVSMVWNLIAGDDNRRFSDKSVGLDASVRFGPRLEILGEVLLNDFDGNRVGDVLDASAAYRLRAVTTAGDGTLAVEGARIGPTVYRHHQFTSGMTLRGVLLGSELGPDARGVRLEYEAGPRGAWRPGLVLSWEERSGDDYDVSNDPVKDIFRSVDGPDEGRVSVEAVLAHSLAGTRSGLEIRAGATRITHEGHVAGSVRLEGALLLRLWWMWRR